MLIRLWFKPLLGGVSALTHLFYRTDGKWKNSPCMHEASYIQLQYLFKWLLWLCFGTTARPPNIEMLIFLSFENVYTRPAFKMDESKRSTPQSVWWISFERQHRVLSEILFKIICCRTNTISLFQGPNLNTKQHLVLDRHWGMKKKKKKDTLDWCNLLFSAPTVKSTLRSCWISFVQFLN